MSSLNVFTPGVIPHVAVLSNVPGPTPVGGVNIGLQRLPTDAIGIFTLVLTNLVVGSRILIEKQAGEFVEFRIATSSQEAFDVPAYSVGNSNNFLVIKVRKGSESPFFQPFETQATAVVGSQSIFVSQIPDE